MPQSVTEEAYPSNVFEVHIKVDAAERFEHCVHRYSIKPFRCNKLAFVPNRYRYLLLLKHRLYQESLACILQDEKLPFSYLSDKPAKEVVKQYVDSL